MLAISKYRRNGDDEWEQFPPACYRYSKQVAPFAFSKWEQ